MQRALEALRQHWRVQTEQPLLQHTSDDRTWLTVSASLQEAAQVIRWLVDQSVDIF